MTPLSHSPHTFANNSATIVTILTLKFKKLSRLTATEPSVSVPLSLFQDNHHVILFFSSWTDAVLPISGLNLN